MDRRFCEFDPVDPARWRDEVQAALKGSIEDLRTTLEGDIEVEPLYPTAPPEGSVSAFGPLPSQPCRPWVVAQEYGAEDPKAIVAALQQDRGLDLGAAWVRLDPGLRCGCEVPFGPRPGTVLQPEALATVVEAAGDAAVFIDAGAGAGRLREAWNARAAGERRGGLLADPLGALAESGVLGSSVQTAIDELLAQVEAVDPASSERLLSVSGLPYHDAGANAGQELGAALATLIDLCRRGHSRGIAPRVLLERTVLRLTTGSDLFMEIAELRAARILWHAVAGSMIDDPPPPWISARTAWRNRTARDPWVNMLRGTVETFAAVAGGADEVVAQPFSEVRGTPEHNARRWALSGQHLLGLEAHVGQVRDPAGGSPYVEYLTQAIADRAWTFVRTIEAAGGMAAALERGVVQTEIARTQAQRRHDAAVGREALTGVSVFPNLDEPPIRVEAPVPDVGAFGAGPAAIELAPLAPVRLAEPFEALRDRSDVHREKYGARPIALLVTVGPSSAHRGRLELARAMVPVGGFDVQVADESGAPGMLERVGARFAVICGSDDALSEAVSPLVEALKNAGAQRVWAVARPGSLGDRIGHVDGLLHPRADLPKLMTELHDALEVGR